MDAIHEIMDDAPNNKLIRKLLATPIEISQSSKPKMGGGMMGMFGLSAKSNLKEEDVRIDMRESAFLKRYKSENEIAQKRKVITWMNNIERDKKYKNYYRDLQALKSFMAMQQIVPIQKNMYNAIAIFDPIDFDSFSIFAAIQDGVAQGLPLHFGFILHPNLTQLDEHKRFISKRIMQCVVWLLNNSKSSSKQSSVFLNNLYSPIIEEVQRRREKQMEATMAQMQREENENAVVEDLGADLLPTERDIEDAILEFVVVDKSRKDQTKQSVLNDVYSVDIFEYLQLTSAFLEDKGITSLLEPSEDGVVGCLLALNGRIFPHISGEFSVYTLIGIMMEEQRSYLMSYSMGKISKRTNFNNFVYEKADVLPRFSRFLSWLNNKNLPKEIQTNDAESDKVSNDTLTVLHPKQLGNADEHIVDTMYWDTIFSASTDSDTHVITAWLVVDMQSVIGRFLLSSFSQINGKFVKYAADAKGDDGKEKIRQFGLRFAVLINSESDQISKECEDVNQKQCEENGVFSWELFAENAAKCVASDINPESLTDSSAYDPEVYKYLTNTIGLQSNRNYIVLNGQVIPLDHFMNDKQQNTKNPITTNDIWTLLTRYNEEIQPIMITLFNPTDGVYEKEATHSLNNAVMRIVNVLYYRRFHEGFRSSQSLFTIAESDETLRNAVDSLSVRLYQSTEDGAPFLIRCVLDPLSQQTQRIISFIDELYRYHNLFDIEICFNPISEMKDEINRYGFPKKVARYYRYVFNPNNFINASDAADNSKAVFANMPSDDVLTMGITDTPGTWLYESLICKHDLDNLLLSKIDGSQSNVLSVNYHLSMLILQGQCFDEKQQPVPGNDILIIFGAFLVHFACQ